MANMLVEVLVFLFRDVRFPACPQGGGPVQAIVGTILASHDDRYGNMIGMGAHDVFQARPVEKFLRILGDAQHDPRAALQTVGLADFEAALAVAGPTPALYVAGLAREDVDLVGDHERGIKADAELADQRQVFLGVALHLFQERACARFGDRAQILDQVRSVHADAVVGNRQRAGVLVDRKADLEGGVIGQQVGRRQRGVAQPIARVRRVRDQFAQKDVLLAVERAGDDIQQSADFSLKFKPFFGHGRTDLRFLQYLRPQI